jgi:cytochrome c-type biogenesis protein CcmH
MKYATAVIVLIILALPTLFVAAQNTEVTDDEVNAIAKRLFCPVCENIPLDTCGTAACQDWRDEIRAYLEQGWTEQQIIDDFIARFGDRVFGIPQDPALNALSRFAPWVIAALGLAIAVFTFVRWRGHQGNAEKAKTDSSAEHEDALRSQLERDLQNIR